MVVYLDDFLIFGSTISECLHNTKQAISLLEFLGFLINWEKSELEPTRSCKFLGMIINSTEITLELPTEKRIRIHEMLDSILSKSKLSLHDLEKCIRILVAACLAVAYSWLNYKELEILKQDALILHNFNPNSQIVLTKEAIRDLEWWRSQITTAKNKIRSSTFDLEIFSDASGTGWGATYDELKAKGFRNEEERVKQINYLELKAAFLALKCFASTAFNKQRKNLKNSS